MAIAVNAVKTKKRRPVKKEAAGRCPDCPEGVTAICPSCGNSEHRHTDNGFTVQCITKGCGRFFIPKKILEDELARRKKSKKFGLTVDVRAPGQDGFSGSMRIRSKTPGHVQQLSGSWRVHCKSCGGDISEPLDKRTAKKFLNEHKKNQRHEATLIREGLKC